MSLINAGLALELGDQGIEFVLMHPGYVRLGFKQLFVGTGPNVHMRACHSKL
jgi:hypothetical protein